jgi:hypothetical protein
MAKVAFSKLNKVKSIPDSSITIGENVIEVKQYLGLVDKIDLMTRVAEQAGDEMGFFNIIKIKTFYIIEMIKAYTNITFTDKQMEDIGKLYDAIVMNKIWEQVSEGIPEEERVYIWENTLEITEQITKYNSSVLGILKTIKSDYSETEFDLEKITDMIQDPEQLKFVKGMLENI